MTRGLLLLAALAMAGCISISRDSAHFLGVAYERHDEIDRIEGSRSGARIRRLTRYLEEEASFDQPLAYYQNRRDADLAAMQGSKRAKLSEDGAAGVPLVFQVRVEAALRAHLGLARARLDAGEGQLALAQVSTALARAQRQLPTRRGRATWSARCFTLNAEIHERLGHAAAARAARLQADLIADYGRSEGGARDFYDDEALFHGELGRSIESETDSAVWDTNLARIREQAQRNAKIKMAAAGISAAAVRTAASIQLESNGGVVTPEIERARVYADLLDTHVEALGGAQGVHALDGKLVLSPAVSDVILAQLADSRLRVDALALVRTFAEEIPALAGREEIAEHAKRAIRLVDTVQQAARGTTTERVEAARALASELSDLVATL